MSATVTTYGYLDLPYLNDPYGAGVSTYAFPFQVKRQIDSTRDVNAQIQRIAAAIHNVDVQINRNVSSIHNVGTQISEVINSYKEINAQINRNTSTEHDALIQINRLLSTTYTKLAEINRGKLLHATCDDAGYLTDAYLTFGYLVRTFCVTLGAQVNRINTVEHPIDGQVQRQISTTRDFKAQVQRQIDAQHAALMQVDRVKITVKGAQILFTLYNTYNLRILCDFPSRGTTGLNWTASSTATGDFSVYNLNTDIVEQVWRSVSGVKTGVVLTCDTEIAQGVFLDTLAMLNHNLTRSATVQFQGSNDAGFATIGFDENLEVLDDVNLYYIAPTLPQVSFRYWRFIINDSTNTNDSLQIGTIVFGPSVIFQGECFVDQVQRGTKHFSDKIETEGFTNVSNDRALKYSTQLEFKFLNFQKGNYRNIRNIFRTARTSLKCLWIPTPQFPERFAVFGKLTQIPVETHKVISEDADYVSFNLEVDESL
jgi:hypothetical protein